MPTSIYSTLHTFFMAIEWVSVCCVLELKCFNPNTAEKKKIATIKLPFGFSGNRKIELALFKWHFNDIISNSFRKLNFLKLRPFSNYKFRKCLIKIEHFGMTIKMEFFTFWLKPSKWCLMGVNQFSFLLAK